MNERVYYWNAIFKRNSSSFIDFFIMKTTYFKLERYETENRNLKEPPRVCPVESKLLKSAPLCTFGAIICLREKNRKTITTLTIPLHFSSCTGQDFETLLETSWIWNLIDSPLCNLKILSFETGMDSKPWYYCIERFQNIIIAIFSPQE